LLCWVVRKFGEVSGGGVWRWWILVAGGGVGAEGGAAAGGRAGLYGGLKINVI